MDNMQARAGIVSWGSYVPRNRITADEIASVHGQDASKIKSGLMISEKSVPAIDEDTITISVEAARQAVKRAGIVPKDIGAIYIGSESHPYAVKPSGTVVAEALQMGPSYTTADLEFACKAGTAGIQIGLAFVKSGMAKLVIAGGADTAQSRPGDALEFTAAAGGAVFVIGTDKVCAIINHTVSFTSDTPDFWRRPSQKHPMHAGAFTGEPAYYRHVIEATKMLMEKAGTKPKDYAHVVFHQPNGKFPRRAAKELGFSEEQLKYGLLVGLIGNTYSGASMLGLASVLDHARPGERILVTSYGSGAGSDSFDITVTDMIDDVQKRCPPVLDAIKDKRYITYSEYMRLSA